MLQMLKMNCICRSNCLRIFIQGLTELHPRSNQYNSPIAFGHAHTRQPTRLFSSAAVANYPRQRWRTDRNETPAGTKDNAHDASNTGAADVMAKDLLSLPESVFARDFEAAKQNGAILIYNPESIESLNANLRHTKTPVRKDKSERNSVRPYVQARSQLEHRPKQPNTSSQLKRLKIIKEDVKTKSPFEERKPWKPHWQIQKEALKEKFPEGWQPRKRLSPDALDGIRQLHQQFPQQYTTEVLARHFEVSPEAIRRILKSKWTPSSEEEMDRQRRWFNRGKGIWSHMAELGKKPPVKWRREGIVRDPKWNEKRGPRTEWPYVPRRDEQPEETDRVESVQRRLSGSFL
ncbi:hypothetical protein F4777DRAFT_533638 [Nemania sp. FL0916]|nr:hypothetical protein F4777DRAFT_533638 [Nemania sp. FL0916]